MKCALPLTLSSGVVDPTTAVLLSAIKPPLRHKAPAGSPHGGR